MIECELCKYLVNFYYWSCVSFHRLPVGMLSNIEKIVSKFSEGIYTISNALETK